MLIGLAGAAGAGKGSTASFLVARGFRELAFADPLYAAASAIIGLPVVALKDRKIKERTIDWLGKSPRELLQLLGTEFGRQMIGESIWVERTMRTAEALAGDVVITDVRFDNEAEAVKDRGGVVWEIVRNTPSCLDDQAARHASEAGISRHLIDLVIGNDGNLADLGRAVDAALSEATDLYT